MGTCIQAGRYLILTMTYNKVFKLMKRLKIDVNIEIIIKSGKNTYIGRPCLA